jgi:AraC-like DNA-binding protein
MARVYRELPRERMPAALAEAVLWWRAPTAGDRLQRVVPDGCLDVIWADGHVFVAGPDTVAHLAPVGPAAAYVGLRFTAGSGPAALGVPADELRDARVPLDGLSSPGRVRAWSAALERRSLPELARLVRAGADGRAGADLVTRAVWRSLHGGGRVDATAATVGLSARQLHRRCLTSFGYGPKTLGRILRFDRAVALARTGAALADVAATAGYADQAHLSRDVRALAGVPLGELLGFGRAHSVANRSTPLPSGSCSTA